MDGNLKSVAPPIRRVVKPAISSVVKGPKKRMRAPRKGGRNEVKKTASTNRVSVWNVVDASFFQDKMLQSFKTNNTLQPSGGPNPQFMSQESNDSDCLIMGNSYDKMHDYGPSITDNICLKTEPETHSQVINDSPPMSISIQEGQNTGTAMYPDSFRLGMACPVSVPVAGPQPIVIAPITEVPLSVASTDSDTVKEVGTNLDFSDQLLDAPIDLSLEDTYKVFKNEQSNALNNNMGAVEKFVSSETSSDSGCLLNIKLSEPYSLNYESHTSPESCGEVDTKAGVEMDIQQWTPIGEIILKQKELGSDSDKGDETKDANKETMASPNTQEPVSKKKLERPSVFSVTELQPKQKQKAQHLLYEHPLLKSANYSCKVCAAVFAVGAAAIQHLDASHGIRKNADNYVDIPKKASENTREKTVNETWTAFPATNTNGVKISDIPEKEICHSCRECDSKFDSLMEAMAHVSQAHQSCESEEKYEEEPSNQALILSQTTCHFCKSCSKISWSVADIETHVLLHMDLTAFEYSCLICRPKRSFDCLNSVLAHHSATHMIYEPMIDQKIQDSKDFYTTKVLSLDYDSGMATEIDNKSAGGDYYDE